MLTQQQRPCPEEGRAGAPPVMLAGRVPCGEAPLRCFTRVFSRTLVYTRPSGKGVVALQVCGVMSHLGVLDCHFFG